MRSCLTLFKKREGFFLCCVFVLTLLLYLPQIFLREAILRDVALRYAPMAGGVVFSSVFLCISFGSFFVAPAGENFSEKNGGKLLKICRSEKSNSMSGS